MEPDGALNADVDIFERFSRIYKELRELKVHSHKITENLRATRERNVQLAQHQQLVRKELQLAKHELNLMRAENINLRVALKLKIGNSGGNQVEKEGSKNAASSCSGRGGHGAKKQDVHPIQPAKSKSSVIVEQKETKVKVENHSDQQDDTSSYAKALDTQTIPKKPLDVVPKDELEWDDISFDSLSRNGENTPPQSPSTSLENSRPTTLSVSENSADLLKKTKSPRRRNPTLTVCYKEPSLKAKLRQGDRNTFGETKRSRKPSKRAALKEIN